MELQQYQEAIENEPLSEDEVRMLLGRIGEQEFGGSDVPTLGAVAEASGRSAVDIAAILESIRGETFEKRFGHRLDEIQTLAADTAAEVKQLRDSPAPTAPPGPTIVYQTIYTQQPAPKPRAPFTGMDEENESVRRTSPQSLGEMDVGQFVSWAVGAVLFALLVFAIAAANSHRASAQEPNCYRSVDGVDGHQIPIDCRTLMPR